MGYVNAPQGRNPWISEPPMPQISHRQPFPSYHTSTGNINREWNGDQETNVGSRLGQIAYGQSMYVSEWIRPQIDANEAKAKAKAQKEGGEGEQRPPSVADALSKTRKGVPVAPTSQMREQPALPRGNRPRYGTLRNPDGSLIGLPQTASPGNQPGRPVPSPLAIGPTGNPGAWGGGQDPKGIPMPPGPRTDPAAGFGQRLTQSRLKNRSVAETGPSLLGALPAPESRVGPSVKRRGISGMDARKRGTFFNYE